MPTIDNKIVQMNFENKQFERGVKESLHSLEELKKALDLDKSAQSLQNLERAAARFDISGIAKGVDSIADRFSLLGNIGQEIFHRISKTAVDAMQNVVHTITAMPQAGLSKYESKNKAVQMIQGALPEKSIEEIEEVLGRLNEYTDLTSYDFTTMAQSIGKFTSAGVDLEVAERVMEGIANETASAGGEIYQANIAMYNFSQALAAGAVKLMDWRSIQNANLDTKEFKETIIDTAVELGILQDAGKGQGVLLKKTSKGVQKVNVDYKTFANTLSEAWFTSDVLIKTMEKYANREEGVGKKGFEMAKIAITLTQAFDAVKDAISTNWMTTWQYVFGNLEEAGQLFTRISDALIDFTGKIGSFRNSILEGWHTGGEDGISGYTMAIEAMSNAWHILMGIAEAARVALVDVFGELDATPFIAATQGLRDFTQGIADFLGYSTETKTTTEEVIEYIDAVSEWTQELKRGMKKNDLVKQMQEDLLALGDDLIRLDKHGADGIFGPETEAAVKAFQKKYGLAVTGVYDEMTRNKLAEIIPKKEIKTLNETEETITHIGSGLELIRAALRGVFSIAKVGINVIKLGLSIAGRIISMLAPIGQGLLSLVAGIGDATTYFVDFVSSLLSSETAMAAVNQFLTPLTMTLKIIGGLLYNLGDGISKIVEMAGKATSFEALGEMLRLDPETNKNAIWLYNIIAGIRNVINQVRPSVERIAGVVSGFFAQIKTWVSGKITAGLNAIGSFFTDLWSKAQEGDYLQKALNGVATGLKIILGIVAGAGYGLYSIGKAIIDGAVAVYEFVKNSELLKNIMSTLSTFFAPVSNFFKTIWDGLSNIRGLIPTFKSFTQFWNAFIGQLVQNPIGSKLVRPLSQIKNAIAQPIKKIKELADNVRTAFQAISQFGGAENAFTELMKDPEKNKGAINTIKFLQNVRDIIGKIRAFAASVRQTVSNVFGQISPALREFGTAAWDSIKNFFGGNGTSAFDKVGGWFETVKTAFKKYWGIFSNWVSGVVANSPFLSALKEFGKLVVQAFSDFFAMDTSGAANAGEAIMMRLHTFDPVIDWIKEKYGILKKTFTGEGSLLGKVKEFFSVDEGSVLGTIISGAEGLLRSITGNFNLDATWSFIKKAFNVFMLATIVRTLSRFSKSIAILTGADQKQADKGKFLLEMAISIGIIAGALALLAKIDAVDALKGVGVMTLALIAISGAMIALSKLASNLKGVGAGILMISISIGLVLLSIVGAMKLLQDNPPEKLIPAMVFVGSILGVLSVLAVAIGRFSKTGGSLGGAAIIAALCLGLNLVIRAVGKLAKMFKDYDDDYSHLDNALKWMLGLIVSLGAVAIGISRFGSTGGSIGGALMLFAFCVALNSAVRAIGTVANLIKKYPNDFDKAFATVETIILSMGGMIALLGIFGTNWGSILSSVAPILAMGYVMNVLISTISEAIQNISGVDPAIVASFMEGVQNIMVILGAAIGVFSMIPLSAFLSESVGFVALMAAIGLGLDIAAGFVSDAMDKMSTALWLVGSRLADFSDFMTRVDTSVIETSMSCLVDKILPAIGDIVSYGPEVEASKDVAKNIWLFGVALDLFNDSISGITEQSGSGIKQLVTDIDETVNAINAIRGIDTAINVLENLGAAMGLYYGNLKMAAQGENGETVEVGGNFDIGKANEAFQHLADLTLDDATIKKIQSYATGGENDLNSMAVGIQNLGVALKNYGENVGTLKEDPIKNANTVLGMALDIQTALNDASAIPFNTFKGQRPTLTSFGLDIAALGGALKDYGDSIEGLNIWKITLAKTTMMAITEIADNLPKTGGIVQFVEGTQSLDQFAVDMSALGDGMAQYADKVSKANFSNVEASVSPMQAIATVSTELDKTGGLQELLNGRKDLGTLGDGLADFGDDLMTFYGKVQDFDANSQPLKDALSVLGEVVHFQRLIRGVEDPTAGLGISQLSWEFGQFFDAMAGNTIEGNGIQGALKAGVDAINSYKGDFEQAGLNLDLGLAKGIRDGQMYPIGAMGIVARGVIDRVLKTFVIRSPSHVFQYVGSMLDSGLAVGLSEHESIVTDAGEDISKKCISSITEGLLGAGGIASAVGDAFSKAKENIVDGFGNGLIGIQDIIDDEFDDEYSISAVINLENADSIPAFLSGLFKDQVVNAGVDLSSGASGLLSGRSIANSVDTANSISNGKGVTIVQNSGGADNAQVVSAINELNSRMDEMTRNMMNLRVVMNTGALVGQLAGPIDQKLGEYAYRNARRG